jgi:hypothetical protein
MRIQIKVKYPQMNLKPWLTKLKLGVTPLLVIRQQAVVRIILSHIVYQK